MALPKFIFEIETNKQTNTKWNKQGKKVERMLIACPSELSEVNEDESNIFF